MVANGGLNIMAAGTPLKSQVDIAILAITRKCSYDCKHCYEHFNLAETDSVPIERWKEVIKDLQKMGTSIITLSGGEPMLRYKGLKELLESADKNLSEFHIYTSGHRVDQEKALALKDAGLKAAAIGLDDVNPDRHDELRGYKGSYKEAIQAIKYFYEADVFTYLNLCLTKDLVRSGELWKYYELAKDLKAGGIRLLEPRPCGGYLSHKADNLFSENDRKVTTEFFLKSNRAKKYKDYPFVSYQAYLEDPSRLGCLMGGHTHFHIDSLGNVEPCVFLPISFGNIMEEDFSDIFKKMRKAIPHPLHKQCPGVSLAEKIKMKKNNGIPLPIPYREMEKEWQQMFA
jgi:MoaA/NifB/PqqE/SkfB family radical SAM enzyme